MSEYLVSTLWLFGEFSLLIPGDQLVVHSATVLSTIWGVSPLLIGLTVVAFETSSSEMAVTIQSSMASACGLALGNVVGSNICNVLFVLGVSAIIALWGDCSPFTRRTMMNDGSLLASSYEYPD